MLQQNRYCGIIFRKPSLSKQLPQGFRMVEERYFVKSDHDELWDGFQYAGGSAFSSVVKNADSLTLTRDRVGVRTLYFVHSEDYFCFSNSLHLLKEVPFITFAVNYKAAFHFFITGKTTGLLQGIQEIDPGSTVEYNMLRNEITVLAADLKSISSTHDDEEQAVTEQRNHILDATRAILDASSDTASFLSGGVDSSVIAAATKVLDVEIPMITAMTGESELDEVKYAGDVVHKLNLEEWHQVLVGNIDLEIEKLHVSMELPTTSLGSFMQYELMRFCAHKGIKHVLDGTGADALYGGHNYYKAIYWNELLRKRNTKALKEELSYPPTEQGALRYFMKNMMLYYYIPRFRTGSKMKFHTRNNQLLGGLNSDFVLNNQEVLASEPGYDLRSLNVFLRHQFYGGSVTELLRFTDRMGKFFGVMNHPIFCQHEALYTSALSLPASFKIQKGVSKSLLRKTFASILPESVIHRSEKRGLVAPNNRWMREHKDLLLSYISDDLAIFYDVPKMRSLLSAAIDEAGVQENYKIFRFLSFAIWHKVYIA